MDLEKFKILFLSFSFAIIISLIVQKVVKVFIEEEDYKKININRLTRFLIISTFLYAISIFKIYDDNLYILIVLYSIYSLVL